LQGVARAQRPRHRLDRQRRALVHAAVAPARPLPLRGILDETHVRLYTRQSFRALFESSGLRIVDEDATVIPLEQLFARAEQAGIGGLVEQAEYSLARLWPSLFAYQIILQAEAAAES
jgi:hypothetical protein